MGDFQMVGFLVVWKNGWMAVQLPIYPSNLFSSKSTPCGSKRRRKCM